MKFIITKMCHRKTNKLKALVLGTVFNHNKNSVCVSSY